MIAKVRGWIDTVVTFFNDVVGELKKSAWPSRSALIEQTMVVILSVIVLGAFVGLCDQILVLMVRLLTQITA